ncbi:hypothetical protein L210DRAFT_3769414 [Boletus edulis BED1]|uniref:Uncharacterized protein n=1 Tax=Boletus edulis BED1 TaxID=1328754 RepID=A0AAD4G4F9_BOLED|nr:hypothetical protein L210DRAFT_3769414 [Boletus edulis BED1]
MAQDPTTSPQRPQASHPHPALQSTPQAKGSATISEHINTVGIQVSDIRPWIMRDVEKFQECDIDEMLKDLLMDCTNKSQKSVDNAYKMCLFQRSGIQIEKELYPVFVQAANTALLFLEELGIEDIWPAEGPSPDVIVVSNEDVCDEDGSPGDICSQKDLFLGVATKPPSSKKEKPFEWRDVRTFVEFKKAKNNMEPLPERYYSQKYTPPQEKYLTLDMLSEPDLGALPEAHVSSGVNP